MTRCRISAAAKAREFMGSKTQLEKQQAEMEASQVANKDPNTTIGKLQEKDKIVHAQKTTESKEKDTGSSKAWYFHSPCSVQIPEFT